VSAILRVSRVVTYDQRIAIAEEADDEQESIVASILASGFTIDWSAVEREASGDDDPLRVIEAAITNQLASPRFRETIDTLDLNGRLLAAYVQRQHERLAGLRLAPIVTFAEPEVFTPERAVAYWRKKLALSDEQAADLLARLGRGESPLLGMRERIKKSLLDRILSLFDEAIAQGTPPREFAQKLRELPTPKGWSGGLEDVTKAVIETEYRTNLSESYNESAAELVLERAPTFPFRQFMAIRDSRVTWWICEPMGTCINGRGFIVATTDPLSYTTWRLPAHYRCRSAWSPISYREAQRLGILAADGRTKIARIGGNPDRPFGEPPEFATHPETGDTRRVEPQEGFGA